MKPSRPLKKKKKERTWAEAITEALRLNDGKIMGLKEIHDKIFLHKLKDIGMTKTDEKNLRTMLAQHTSTPAAAANCSFYRVKDRPGYYGLKEEALLPKPLGVDSLNLAASVSSLKRKMKDKEPTGLSPTTAKKKFASKMVSASITKRSNSFTGSALRKARLLTQRRTSSPNMVSTFANLRHRSSLQNVQRSRSTNSLFRLMSNPNTSRRKMLLDLETPSSVLTNTRLKSVINSATFSMLPASYQYQLIQLLPQVDRKVDENNVQRISQSALNNEFYSQALQDWSTQLLEGEFTRETQARIMQEISRERSKINPWKEKFFEEYYGQRKELKRTRSRSHDMGNSLTDLSFEAQLAKFSHLATGLANQENKDSGSQSSEVIVVPSSESDEDPDYAGAGQVAPPPLEKDLNKPINKRKISKPFKRTVYNSSVAYPTSTAMIHRKGGVNASAFSQFTSNATSKFQARDETYRSYSDASDEDLSDSNSFHQHDETSNDEGESSDDLMNTGDGDLFEVDDGDSSDECNRPIAELVAKPSNTKITARRKSLDKDATVSKHKADILDIAKRHIDDNSKSSSNVLQQILKVDESRTGALSQEKKITVAESKKSLSPNEPPKNENVAVVFGHGLQSSISASYGDSIIPRISATSGLLSHPVAPTTVCTAATPARAMKDQRPVSCQEGAKSITIKHEPVDKKPSPPSIAPAILPKMEATPKQEKSDDLGCYHNQRTESTGDSGSILSKPSYTQRKQGLEISTCKSSTTGSVSNSTASVKNSPLPRSSSDVKPPGTAGVKRPNPPIGLSPVKRTKTLAEIKAQMKAKRLAVATASPGINVPKPTATPLEHRQPASTVQPSLSQNSTKLLPVKKATVTPPPIVSKIEKEASPVRKSATGVAKEVQVTDRLRNDPVSNQDVQESDTVKTNTGKRKEVTRHGKEKIILKIKGGVVENRLASASPSPLPELSVKSSDSDDEQVMRKSRRLSHVIVSSGDSSDDLDAVRDSSSSVEKVGDNYSMLSQLALPAFSSKLGSDGLSLLKRTPKSPVFGAPPFDAMPKVHVKGISISSTNKDIIGQRLQPFMTEGPVIGFHDIPSHSTISSTVGTFVHPTATATASAESQKYRSTSQGKSLVKMQQLAESVRVHSDESDRVDSDTEDDSAVSTASSTEEEQAESIKGIGRSMLRKRDPVTGRVENSSHKSEKTNGKPNGEDSNCSKKKLSEFSDCDDSCSSSSEDKPIISECICACKRLVLCKGCGAYTHEECLSSTKLCSLCVL